MIKIKCDKRDAHACVTELLTCGSVGVPIKFEFSPDWDGLTKTAVFKGSTTQRDVLLESDTTVIPWEVLARTGALSVGVYGIRGTELVIPTVYAFVGNILVGADPSGDPGIPPTPSILDQVLTAAERTQENAEAVQSAKESVDNTKAQIDLIAERVIEEAGTVAESVEMAAEAAKEAQRMAAEASRVASEALEIEGDVLAARDRAEAAADSSETILEEITDIQTGLQTEIDSINEKIPEQASSENQLADKDFVNSSVATNTANYISNENNEPFASLADLQAYSGPLTNNDYAFVIGQDEQGNVTYTRYKYNASSQEWAKEYVLNNSSFTAAQWAAINSGITALAVEQIETNRAAISDILTTLALKANDADVYHEWKYGYNATAQAITMNGNAVSFADAYAAIEDKSKFVYVEYSNRVYIPQYVSSGLIYFVASFIDGGMLKTERIMFNATTGKALTASLSAYDTVKIDTLLAGKQDTISDLQTIRTGAENGTAALEETTQLKETKADKSEVATLRTATGEIALALGNTVKEADYIKRRMNGILYAEENDTTEALTKTVPQAAMGWAEVLKLGGKSEVRDGEIVSADVESVDVHGVNLAGTYSENSSYHFFEVDLLQNVPYYVYTTSRVATGFDSATHATVRKFGSNQAITLTEEQATHAKYLFIAKSEGTVETLKPMIIRGEIPPSEYKPYTSNSIPIPSEVRALDGYGLSDNTIYKTDAGWSYEQKRGNDGELLPAPVVTDITDLVGDALAPFRVEEGGTATFRNSANLPVPSTIQYAIDLEAI